VRSRRPASSPSAARWTTRSWAIRTAGATRRPSCRTGTRPPHRSRADAPRTPLARGNLTMELFQAGWLLPIAGPPLRDGRVAVSGRRIAWVGRPGDPGAPSVPVQHLGEGVLLPGLVNAHCHLELSHLASAGLPSGAGFVPWVEAVVASRGRHSEAEMAAAAA